MNATPNSLGCETITAGAVAVFCPAPPLGNLPPTQSGTCSPILSDSEATAAQTPGGLLEYQPPPVDCLPFPLGEYAAKSAEAIGCDPALVAMPALAACAAAIGDSRSVEIKPDWTEPPVIWTLCIAPSGALKTPAMKAAMAGMEAAQQAAFNTYAEAEARHKTALADWVKGGKTGAESPPPALASYYVSDATIEAVCARLKDNPRGLLQKRDELSGWLGGFDKYSEGNEAAQWLEFHSGNSLRIDRKGGDTPTIYIPRALVSVTGTIQEKVLQRLLSADEAKHFDNGLAARFQMAMPPERAREWREESVPPALAAKYCELFRDLLALAPDIAPDTGRREPRRIRFSPAAKLRFVEFVNMHGREMRVLQSDRLKSAWSKLEAQAARLALISHCIQHAFLPAPGNSAEEISLATLESALRWLNWLKNETRRIYYALGRAGEVQQADKLIAFVRRNGGQATARDAARVGAGGKTTDDVERLMCSLVTAGFGEFVVPVQPKGGRPTRVFRLKPAAPDGQASLARCFTDETPLALPQYAAFSVNYG